MPTTLYQKYRPKIWADVTNQQVVKVTLTNQIARETVAHAYLFVGPRGVGKTTTARLLAKSVNCLSRKKGETEPCNACASCNAIQDGTSLDVIEIDAASHTGVDHVRERIIEGAEVTAGTAKYRVYIVDEVHMLSLSAFNAMLKILEEPPAHVLFILATTEIHKVPATIISRCQRFDFTHVAVDGMVERLKMIARAEEVEVDDEVFPLVAIRAEGSLRDAESIFGQILALGEKKIGMDVASLVLPRSDMGSVAALMTFILKGDASGAIGYIQTLVQGGVSVPLFMTDCLGWLRLLLLHRVADRLDVVAQYASTEHEQKVLEQSSLVDPKLLRSMMEVFLKWRKQISDSPIAQLPLELAAVECAELIGPHVEEPPVKKILPPEPVQEKPFSKEPAQEKIKEVELPQSKKKTVTRSEVNLTKEQVGERWQDYVDAVKEGNHALAFLLSGVSPEGVEDGVLRLNVPFSFHQERLSEPKIQNLLAAASARVFGSELLFDTRVIA